MTKESASSSIGTSLISFASGVVWFPLLVLIGLAHVAWVGFALYHLFAIPIDTVMRGDELWRTKTAMYAQLGLTVAWCFWLYHIVRTETQHTSHGMMILNGLAVLSGLVTLWWLSPVFL